MQALITDSHPIYFGRPALQELSKLLGKSRYSSVFILTDTNTAKDCYPRFCKEVPESSEWGHLSMPAGEAFKNIRSCLTIWEGLSEAGADRNSLLINLGGGVVTDLGGFVASTYQRGIDFVNIPTTLLAMVDASVGGKTGVDLGSLKNQVGLIRQPEMVLIDPQYLETLDPRERRSGFSEMLKHGLISDPAYWEQLSGLDPEDAGEESIRHSVQIKNEVVREDPTEKGLRKILNFGHTLGHAVESHFLHERKLPTLLHGEAIAVGMVLEAHLSVATCGLPQTQCDQIKDTFARLFPKTNFSSEQISSIRKLLVHDKKNTRGRVRFTLLKQIGSAVWDQEVSEGAIDRAFEYYSL